MFAIVKLLVAIVVHFCDRVDFDRVDVSVILKMCVKFYMPGPYHTVGKKLKVNVDLYSALS